LASFFFSTRSGSGTAARFIVDSVFAILNVRCAPKAGRYIVAAMGTGGEREWPGVGMWVACREGSGSCSLDFLFTFSSWKK